MTEIQFYHLTATPLERALPKLLEKAFQGGFRTLVLMKDEEAVERMNAQLWTFGKTSFLPHGSKKDGRAEDQPVYLTADADNANNANLLAVTDGSAIDAAEGFTRVIDLFDGLDEKAVEAARKRYKLYQTSGHTVSYFKQTEKGSWEKAA